MKERFDDIRLLTDIKTTDCENSLLNLSRIKKIAAIAMISTLGFVGANSGNHNNKSEHPKIDKQDTDLVDYNLSHAYPFVDIQIDDETAMLEIKVDKTSDDYLKRVAQECNLTLIDADDYVDKLYGASDYYQSIDCLNDYADKFGFKFTTLDELNSTDTDCSLDSTAILDPDYINEFVNLGRFKQTAVTIMRALEYTPVEFIMASNLKEVRFIKSFGKGRPPITGYSVRSSVPAAIAVENEDTILFAVSSFMPVQGPEIYFHEIGHLIDGQQMGGIQQPDPQYTSLNPDDFEYFDEQSYRQHKSAVVDEYASYNIIEDKAMMYQNFIFGPRLAYSSNPIIQQKTKLLIARLELDIPDISKYYAALCNVDI